MSEINNFIEKTKGVSKTFFSFNDLTKFYQGKQKNLPVIINRLVKSGKIIRLTRGFYTFNLSMVDWEALACEILKPSYISLEYALWKYGIINEIPATITLITTKKHRFYNLLSNTFEYSYINPKIFGGYKIEKNILIAEKEKALLDEVYFISLHKRIFNLKSIDISKINKKILKKWLKYYPPSILKLLQRFKFI
jgi:predicted transcriptional regulator of viral defense system